MADFQGIWQSGGPGGAVASVVGGTAISIDNTDPLNPVINCTFVAPVTSVNGLTGPVTLTAASVGAAPTSHTHAASDVTLGVFNVARLGTGTANNTVYLRGDGAWVGIDGGHITTGTVGTARLGSGTANNTTFLRGDGTWATPSGGITGFTSQISTSAPNATVNVSQLLVAVSTTNGDLALQAKGTGALIAQIPDNTAIKGNKRGEYAVDWQRHRLNGQGVASGQYAVISGGYNGQASGANSVVGGGAHCGAWQQYSTAAGGGWSSAQAYASTVSGGQSNTASGQYSVVCGGESNNASHSHSTIVGGRYGTTHTPGTWVYSNHYNWSVGDAKTIDVIWTGRTTTSASTLITYAGGLAQGVLVPNNSSLTFTIQVAARQLFTTNIAGWTITGIVANISGVITLYNVTKNLIHKSVGAWDVNVVADTANGTINFNATGDNGNAIQWVASGRFTYCIMNG